jgi:hypothetical protein
MDRDSLKSIQNQKVFVPLSAVLEVQTNFNRLVLAADASRDDSLRTRALGMAQVIRSLGLPVDIPLGY